MARGFELYQPITSRSILVPSISLLRESFSKKERFGSIQIGELGQEWTAKRWRCKEIENPIEQLPEGATSEATPATSSQPGSSSYPPEPGLELLAVLLKNPDLVFALKLPRSSSTCGTASVLYTIFLDSKAFIGTLRSLPC
ncbi:hypothetical protein Ancab_023550 [Ancistrocladus abbreviatus]